MTLVEDAITDVKRVEEVAAELDAQPTPRLWPNIHDNAFHGIFRDIADACTANSETDPAAILLTSLTYCAAVIGPGPHVSVGDTKHPARLFAVLCGSSSRARKGTSADSVKRIFEAAHGQIYQATSSTPYPLGNLVEPRPGPLSSGEGLVWAMRDPSEQEKDGESVDVGVEDKRLLIIDGEFGGALTAAERKGNTLSAILRTAWDSGNIDPITKTSRIKVTGGHLCFVGHITINELHMKLQKVDLWNGFANRILWGCVKRSKIIPLPQPMPDEVVCDIGTRIAEKLRHAVERQSVPITPEASAYWSEKYERLTVDEAGIFGAITNRAEAQVIRIALIFALMDGTSIDVVHLKAAIAVWGYCKASARYIFGRYETDPPARKLIEALRVNGVMTRTDVCSLFSGHLGVKQTDDLLGSLELEGEIVIQKSSEGMGRPATVIHLPVT